MSRIEKISLWIFAIHIIVLTIQFVPPTGRGTSFILVGSSATGILACLFLARRGFERIASFGVAGILSNGIYISMISNALSRSIAGDREARINIFLMVCSILVTILTGILLDNTWLFRKVLSTSLIVLFIHNYAVYILDAPPYLLWGAIIYMVICFSVYGIFFFQRTQPTTIAHIKRYRHISSGIRLVLERKDGTILRGYIHNDNLRDLSVNDRILIDQYVDLKDPEIEIVKFRILR